MGWRGRKDCERVRVINSMVSTSVIYGFPNLNIHSLLLEQRIMAVLTLAFSTLALPSPLLYREEKNYKRKKESGILKERR